MIAIYTHTTSHRGNNSQVCQNVSTGITQWQRLSHPQTRLLKAGERESTSGEQVAAIFLLVLRTVKVWVSVMPMVKEKLGTDSKGRTRGAHNRAISLGWNKAWKQALRITHEDGKALSLIPVCGLSRRMDSYLPPSCLSSFLIQQPDTFSKAHTTLTTT